MLRPRRSSHHSRRDAHPDDTATAITAAGGDYVFTVKGITPTLQRKLKALPWKDVPAHSGSVTGHGKRITRTIKVAAVPHWVDFPGAAQVARFPGP